MALPAHWQIHNAFHISLLKPYVGEPPKEPVSEDPPEVDELEEILQPGHIVAHKECKLKGGKLHHRYLVKFKDYSSLDS